MNEAAGIKFSGMTTGPSTQLKEMELCRYVAVWGVMAVSVTVFVLLGKYMGQSLGMSPPITATLLPIAPTAIAGIAAYCLLTPDSNDVKVFKYPKFVGEERAKEVDALKKKDQVFADDLHRDAAHYRIRAYGMTSKLEGEDLGKEWTDTVHKDLPEDAILFANQRLAAPVQEVVCKQIMGDGWIPVAEQDPETPTRGWIVEMNAEMNLVIEGQFRFGFADGNPDPEDPNVQWRYVNTRIVVKPEEGSTTIYVNPPTNKPEVLDMYR